MKTRETIVGKIIEGLEKVEEAEMKMLVVKDLRGIRVFTEFMALMLESGSSLLQALDLFKRDSHLKNNIVNTRAIDKLIERCSCGEQIEKTMGEYQELFTESYITLISVGSRSGDISRGFRQALKYLNIVQN